MFSKKRILSVVLCVVLLLSALFLYGCDSSSSADAEKVLGAYFTATDDANTDGIIELVPPAFINYMRETRSDDGKSEEEINAIIESKYKPAILKMDFMMVYPDIDIAEEFTYEHKVIDSYNAKTSEVKEFNEYVSNKFDFEIDAEKIVLLKYQFSMDSKNDIYEVTDIWDSGVALQIDGEWYYLNNGSANQILWVTMDGLKLEDGVEWMFNWLRDI